MATAHSIEHPHSSHDRTREWQSCCMDIFMGRDPKRQRLNLEDTSEDDEDDSSAWDGRWSSPDCFAIDMTEDANDQQNQELESSANSDSWTTAALALSASIEEVSVMIQRKAVSYVNSTDTLAICFTERHGAGTAMTHADRSILETTVASFAAGMARQIDTLRTVAVEGGHQHQDPDGAEAPHTWASGPMGHRVGIAASLMQRLKLEIMDPMTSLQSQRNKSAVSGDDASKIAQNPLRMFRLGAEESRRRALPPAPWEVEGHDAERDRVEREEETQDFLDVYFEEKDMSTVAAEEEIRKNLLPPASVLRCMHLPKPSHAGQRAPSQYQPTLANPSVHQQPKQNIPTSYGGEGEGEEEHTGRLQQESAMLLASYQHSDLEGVQKVERSMVEITQLLSRFTDLITEQQEDVFTIHDHTLKSKENVDQGQDQLVDAANRGEKSKHPMASFIVVMALLLLLFNWMIP